MPHSKMCKHCGGAEEDHHDYEPSMPDGCVCSPGEWGDVVTDPCEEYQGNGSEYCLRCEHDKACHKGSNAVLSGAPRKKQRSAALTFDEWLGKQGRPHGMECVGKERLQHIWDAAIEAAAVAAEEQDDEA